ncbi:hypothetical protein F5Y10DRAFT_160315 [Nemania abortiva]|nr:hypothetical protein F5Y10DRAFT_160315 [Nemania abortiva]
MYAVVLSMLQNKRTIPYITLFSASSASFRLSLYLMIYFARLDCIIHPLRQLGVRPHDISAMANITYPGLARLLIGPSLVVQRKRNGKPAYGHVESQHHVNGPRKNKVGRRGNPEKPVVKSKKQVRFNDKIEYPSAKDYACVSGDDGDGDGKGGRTRDPKSEANIAQHALDDHDKATGRNSRAGRPLKSILRPAKPTGMNHAKHKSLKSYNSEAYRLALALPLLEFDYFPSDPCHLKSEPKIAYSFHPPNLPSTSRSAASRRTWRGRDRTKSGSSGGCKTSK